MPASGHNVADDQRPFALVGSLLSIAHLWAFAVSRGAIYRRARRSTSSHRGCPLARPTARLRPALEGKGGQPLVRYRPADVYQWVADQSSEVA
jgi:hypothetical protein